MDTSFEQTQATEKVGQSKESVSELVSLQKHERLPDDPGDNAAKEQRYSIHALDQSNY